MNLELKSAARFRLACLGRTLQQCLLATFILAFCSLDLPIPASAQTLAQDPEYVISTWTTANGLPDSSVTSAAQTPDGYLWFGTFNGLVRFDGVKFSVFNPANTAAVPHAGIIKILLDSEKRLWVNTFRGLARLERSDWQTIEVREDWKVPATRLLSLPGNFYALLTARKLLRFHDRKAENVPMPKLAANGIAPFLFFDAKDNLMLASGPFLYRRVASTWQSVQTPPPVQKALLDAKFIQQTRNGDLLVASDTELLRISENRIIRRYKCDLINVFGIEEEPDATLWIASSSAGLVRIALDGTIRRFHKQAGFPSNSLRFVFSDHEGNIWVGTNGDGLIRMRKRTVFTFGTESGLPDVPVKSLAPAPDASIFVGTYGRGVYRLKNGKATQAFPGSPFPPYAQALLVDRTQTLWIGSFNDGLWRSNGSRLERIEELRHDSYTVEALFQDSKGRIWIGTNFGVLRFEAGQFQELSLVDGKNPVPVAAFAESPDSGTIFAVGDGGLYRLENDHFLPVLNNKKPLPPLRSISATTSSSLFLGSVSDGLIEFTDGNWIKSSSPSRSNPAIGDILHIGLYDWLATSSGLHRIIRSDLPKDTRFHSWQSFGPEDGMASYECSVGHQPLFFFEPSGVLWVATLKGVARLDTRHLDPLPSKAISAIDQLTYRDGNSPEHRIELNGLSNITLPPDSWDIRINYTIPIQSTPEKIIFHYLLRNDSSGNLAAGVDSSRELRILRLPHGENHLFINARNAGGEWGEQGATLILNRQPHIYENRLLLVATFLSLLAIAAFFMHRSASEKNKRHLLELHRAREAEESMLRAKQEAENASKLKSLFLANMSHELRTPMNGILGMTQLLKTTSFDTEQMEMIETLQASGVSLLKILNDILDISKIEAGRLEIKPAPMDLCQVVREALELFTPVAAAKQLRLSSYVSELLPAFILCDSLRLRQILLNFLDNALKFTDAGSVELRVHELNRIDDKILIKISVSDTGCGIPADKLPGTFDAFTQVDGSSTRSHGGSGLGLTIVKRLATLMGGDAGAESVVGLGSTFWANILVSAAPSPEPAPTALGNDRTNTFDRPQILVVEDNRINQLVLSRLLGKLGCAVTLANDGVEAIGKVSAFTYDLILMDLQMPRLDGHQATQRIRALQSGAAQTPIIAVSASAMPEDLELCALNGMDGFLAKPVSLEELTNILSKHLTAAQTNSTPIQS